MFFNSCPDKTEHGKGVYANVENQGQWFTHVVTESFYSYIQTEISSNAKGGFEKN